MMGADGLLFAGLVVLKPSERVMGWFSGENLVEHESCEGGERRPALVVAARARTAREAEEVIRRRVSREFRESDVLEVALRDITADEMAVSDEGMVKWPLKPGEVDVPAVYVAVSEEAESVDDMLEWVHELLTGR